LRIHNRFLRNRFEERIECYLDQSKPNYKKSFEYLFYGADSTHPNEIWKILENGYRSPEECEDIGICKFAPLVNSVLAADMSRLHEFIYRKKNEHKKMPNSKTLLDHSKLVSTGMILVCKVIMVKSVQDPRFPNFDPCYSFSDTLKTNPIDPGIFNSNKNQCISVFREKKEECRHRVWFLFDHNLVLPEYLIFFDYLTEPPPMAPLLRDAVFIGDTLLACQNGDRELLTNDRVQKNGVNLDETTNEVVEFIKNKEFNYLSNDEYSPNSS
jgi:hypothetical protein